MVLRGMARSTGRVPPSLLHLANSSPFAQTCKSKKLKNIEGYGDVRSRSYGSRPYVKGEFLPGSCGYS